MKANVIINTYSEQDAQRHERQLRKNGYKVVANCYWTMLFEKDNWVVQLNRDF